MRIVTSVISMASVGGTELNVFQAARGLAERDHSIDLIAARDGDLAAQYRSFCRSVTRLPPLDFARSTAARDLIRMAPAVALAASKRPDVVYPNRFAEVIWAVATGKLTKAPVVCHLHEIRHRRPGGLLNSHVRRFIAVSEFLRDEWAAIGLNPDLIDVVHNGVSFDDYPYGGAEERAKARASLGLPAEAFVVLYLGRLDREKGIAVLLDAWGRLGLGGQEGRLVLVGAPSTHVADGARDLERMREKEPPNCVWLPSRADVVTPLHAADVVVVPSVCAEGLSRVAIEAMATGRPVLGSRIGGIPEVLNGDFDRFLIQTGDAQAWAEALRSLVGWQQSDPDLAVACRRHVHDQFSFTMMVDGIERALLSAVGG